MNVAIYNRISRDNGENEDVLLNHRTLTTRLCDERGYKYKLYEEIESGGKFEERKVLLKLLSDISDNLYDALVVVELSRIARDNLYSQMVAKVLEDNDVQIITPTRTYNLSDESDRIMFDLESMLSSKELRTITRRMKVGKLEGIKRGEWIQGNTPYGYTRGDNKKLIIVDAEAEVVKLIFSYAERGYSIQDIQTLLPNREGTNKWHRSHIQKILHNRVYKGDIVYTVKGKNKTEEVVVTENAHQPIVSNEVWYNVHKALSSRIRLSNDVRERVKGEVLSVLKDLVRCASCGTKLGFRKGGKDKKHTYLKTCKCGNKGVNEKELIHSFWNEFASVEAYLLDELERTVSKSHDSSDSHLLIRMEELEAQIKVNKEKSKRLRDAYVEGLFTREEYFSDKEELNKALSTLEKSSQQVKEELEASDSASIESNVRERLKYLESIREVASKRVGSVPWESLFNEEYPSVDASELEEVNRLLKLVVGSVSYSREDVDRRGKQVCKVVVDIMPV